MNHNRIDLQEIARAMLAPKLRRLRQRRIARQRPVASRHHVAEAAARDRT